MHSPKGWHSPLHLSSLPQMFLGSRAASPFLPRREWWCQLTGELSTSREPSFLIRGATAVWPPMWRAAQSGSMVCGSMVSCPGTKGSSSKKLSFHPFVYWSVHPSFHPSIQLSIQHIHPFNLSSVHPLSPPSIQPPLPPSIHLLSNTFT